METDVSCIAQIAARARSEPDRILLQEVEGRSFTYGAFHDTALRLADGLEAMGVVPGEAVAIMIPTVAEAYMTWIGVNWLGAVPVTVNNEYRDGILRYTLSNSGATTVVVAARYLAAIRAVAGDLEGLRRIVVVGDLPANAVEDRLSLATFGQLVADGRPRERKVPEIYDTAAIIYTSGTTGPSKGVIMPWGTMSVAKALFPLDRPGEHPEGAYYSVWPSYHASGIASIVLAVHFGLRLVLREKFSLSAFWNDIRDYNCTHCGLIIVGSLLHALKETPEDADNPLVSVGMYPLMPNFRDFERRFGVRVSTGFGMTEIGWPLTTGDPANAETCGRLVPGNEVRIVDEHDMEVEVGQVGELIVRHERPWILNKGYLGMPQATLSAWRNGWFHTGDAFRRDDDGNFYFVDRIKDSIKHRGRNISSMEVEVECHAFGGIVECACVGIRSSSETGGIDGDEEVKIFVVREAGQTFSEEDLTNFLLARLPRFMVPRFVEFTDSLPRTPTQKTLKADLRNRPNHDGTWDRLQAGIAAVRAAAD